MIEYKNIKFEDNIEALSFRRYINFYAYTQLSKVTNFESYQTIGNGLLQLTTLAASQSNGLKQTKLVEEMNLFTASTQRSLLDVIEYSRCALECLTIQKKDIKWIDYKPSYSDTQIHDKNIYSFESSRIVLEAMDKINNDLHNRYPTFFNEDFKNEQSRYDLDCIIAIDITKKNWHNDFFLMELERSIMLLNTTDNINIYEGAKDFFRDMFVRSQEEIALQLGWSNEQMENNSIDFFFKTMEFEIEKSRKMQQQNNSQ